MTKIDRDNFMANICQSCQYSLRRESGHLVDCPKVGCGNAWSRDCEHYKPYTNLIRLKDEAVEAICEFEKLNNTLSDRDTVHNEQLHNLACRSCALQEAYAMMIGLGYDDAAEILHEIARTPSARED